MAHALALVVGAIHRRGVIHGDINPANILVDGRSAGPVIIDFDLATTAVEERLPFTHTNAITGTLAYLAPEQTGCTGWAVDPRADLYGLGATLYELTTGRPPFGRGDPLDMVRAQLTMTPQSPRDLNATVPAMLSDIILRLLEKEPDRRYQSAEGLAYDLARLRSARAEGRDESFVLGERDFPLRLRPSSRPVGREAEIAVLYGAFARATAGPAGCVLVAGPTGVGKTTVIDELRSIVTAHEGWVVAGKFDQHRRDTDADAVWQALRAVGRLLLAESESNLADWRGRLRIALGPNAGLLASLLPEFALVLDVGPESSDAADTEGRLIRAAVAVLSVVGSPDHPLVLVVDDLQWASAAAIAVIDAVITERLPGVLLVGAYRDAEVDALHPLSAHLSRWERLGVAPEVIRLGNLRSTDLMTLLAEMLRLSPDDARSLAGAVAARTDGNPFDTVELVNSLRHDGVLTLTEHGWEWNAETIRQYIGEGDVLDLISGRMARLPAGTLTVLGVLSCLGGRVEISLLEAAASRSAAELEDDLQPALEDGLVVVETAGQRGVRFRHDRIRQAAYAGLDIAQRAESHRAIARRLTGLSAHAAVAAEQYLAVTDIRLDDTDRQAAVRLFRVAAVGARLTNPVLAERFLAATESLLGELPSPAATELDAVRQEHHAVLCGLGRFAEADDVYAEIERRARSPLDLAAAACAQIGSFRARNRQPEALRLGLELLTRLGLAVPSEEDLFPEIGRGMAAFGDWVAGWSPRPSASGSSTAPAPIWSLPSRTPGS